MQMTYMSYLIVSHSQHYDPSVLNTNTLSKWLHQILSLFMTLHIASENFPDQNNTSMFLQYPSKSTAALTEIRLMLHVYAVQATCKDHTWKYKMYQSKIFICTNSF